MTQEAQQQNSSQRAATLSASTPVPDDPEPGSDIPLKCSLQWDAVTQQGDVVDAAVAELQARMAALADCILGTGKKADPWPAPAPGGEYVNASGAPASRATAMTYKRQQIDETIGLINGARRRLKDLLRTP
jgi:hypothetical protein